MPLEFQADGGHVHQAHGGQGRLENGDVFFFGFFEDDAGGVDVAGKDEAGDAVLEKFFQALAADGFGQ